MRNKKFLKNSILLLVAIFMASCSDGDKTYYEVKDNKVLYHSVYRKGQEYYTKAHEVTVVLEGANAETFKALSKYYGVDKTSVYHKETVLKKRDPATFKILNHSVTADKYGAYLKNKIITNSDGLSFKFINHVYAVDANQVYYIPSNFYRIIKGADKETFASVSGRFNDYAKDKNYVYFEEQRITNANPNFFEILASDFSKDNQSIFFKNEQIKEADYASFQMLTTEEKQENNYAYDAKDVNHFYGTSPGKGGVGQLKITKQ